MKKLLVGALVASVGLLCAGCGGTSEKQAHAAVKDPYAAQVQAFKKETGGFRPSMQGYFARHLCSNLSTQSCRCVRDSADTDYESAAELETFIIDVIRKKPSAMGTYDAEIADCQ